MSEPKTAVVTGAGSGVGRAVAIALAQRGWNVAALGRRGALLEETASRIRGDGAECLALPVDIGDAAAVEAMARRVLTRFANVDLLVNSAGINVARRSLEELSQQDYEAILKTNLNGAYFCIQAFLPGMRQRGSGTIVNVISDAGKQASPKAGPAYVVSKFGLTGLTQAINAEERARGVRACAVFPGDIDTPLLEKRPAPPSAEARQKMLQPEDVAACVLLAAELPARAIVEEIVIRPR